MALDERRLIDLHKRTIAQVLRPSEILPTLLVDKIITGVKYDEITQCEEKKSQVDAANKLLDYLIHDDKPGWVTSFLRALEKQGYTYILRILEDSTKIREQELYTSFIELFYEQLVTIDPGDIYTYLRQEKCLSDSDFHWLKTTEKQTKKEVVIFNLLRCITKRHDWLGHFVTSLKTCKSNAYSHFIDNLEPKLKKAGFSLQEQLEKLASSQIYPTQHALNATDHDLDRKRKIRPVMAVQPSSGASASISAPPQGSQSLTAAFQSLAPEVRNSAQVPGSHAEMFAQPMQTPPPLAQDSDAMEVEEIEDGHAMSYAETPDDNLDASFVLDSTCSRSSMNEPFPKRFKSQDSSSCLDNPAKEAKIEEAMDLSLKVHKKVTNLPDVSFSKRDRVENTNQGIQETVPPEQSTTATCNFEGRGNVSFNNSDRGENANQEVLGTVPPGQSTTETCNVEGREKEHIIPEEELEEFADLETKELHLKAFQKELAEPCLRGENKIIVAPTNSGKTFVAMAIAKAQLEKHRNASTNLIDKKVVFLVPKVCLAKQQHEQFSTYLPQYNTWHMTGRNIENFTKKVPIDIMFKVFDVIVMTAQILVDGLKAGLVSLQKISLLILDECHRTSGENPMNKVMKQYLSEKIDKKISELPQIVGLTASVGIGKWRKEDIETTATNHITGLCARLDSTIHIVIKETQSLKEHQQNKIKRNTSVSARSHDQFKVILEKQMHDIEKQFNNLREVIPALEKELPVLFPDVGTMHYAAKVESLRRSTITMEEKRREYMSYLDYLKIYNATLRLHEDCQATESLQYMKDEITTINESGENNQVEEQLYQSFKDKAADLERIARADVNPKLMKLKNLILGQLVKDESEKAQAIVIVSTRALTVAIERFLKNDADIEEQNIPVGRFVGSSAHQEKAGMSNTEWNNTLDHFKARRIRILVSTNVVEEGLDIPECSLLVNYERTQDEISKVQSEGRARAKNALLAIISTSDSHVFAKDAINEERVNLMTTTLKKLFHMDSQVLKQRIGKLQEDGVNAENLRQEQMAQQNQSRVQSAHQFHLICCRCESFVCKAEDIRLYHEAKHHVVVDPEFVSRICYKPLTRKSTIMPGGLLKVKKIHCKKCTKQDWGVKSLYDGKSKIVHILAKDKFFLVSSKGKKVLFRKWDDAPFHFDAIELGELLSLCHEEIL